MKTIVWKMLFFLFCGSLSAFPKNTEQNSFDFLSNVPCFAFGGTGYAGTISRGEIAFLDLFKKADAKELFSNLYTNSNNQGKTYALVALHILDKENFDKFSEDFGKNNSVVKIMSGCLIHDSNNHEILKRISSNEFKLYLQNKMAPKIDK